MRLRVPDVAERARPPGGGAPSRRCASSSLYKPPGVAETIDWAHGARRARARPQLDERVGRRHARHGPQVPRGPGAGRATHGLADLVQQAVERGMRQPERRPRRPDAERHRGRVRPACCAAPGSTCRSAASSTFAEALGRGRPRRPRRGVYWAGRATLVRRPEDIAALRPRVRRVLGPRARRRRAIERRPRREITLALDDDDDDRRTPSDDGERRRRRRRVTRALQPQSRCCATRTSPPTPPPSSPRPAG